MANHTETERVCPMDSECVFSGKTSGAPGADGRYFVNDLLCISETFRSINEYTLNIDGMENGINSRKSTRFHKTRNVFLGSRLTAAARIIATARMKIPPDMLICRKLILITSFQTADNLLQFFYLLLAKLLSS